MISEKLGHRLDNVLSRIAQTLFGKKINPHFLTIAGLFINIGAGFYLGMGHWITGGCLICLGGFFDIFDGAVARVSNRVTKFGGFLDSVIDRYSDTFLLSGIIWYYIRHEALGYIFLTLIVLMGSLLIPYSRAKAEIFLRQCNIGLMERAERMILLALGSIFNIMPVALWVLAVFTHVTVIQRIYYTWKEMQKIEGQTVTQ
ncbi:MAG: CDP-alcohol phosphatidyltransferase family protein [Thermodesulfobacteriota bacterium]|jgi:CDP-diacylglycerol--glycerol-3-phosphate 3-phosphatidyltransferase|nr:MAG: CDP-alcohol phosphatidyltransferase family protein [Thermodesulfobacteriota bacterium]